MSSLRGAVAWQAFSTCWNLCCLIEQLWKWLLSQYRVLHTLFTREWDKYPVRNKYSYTVVRRLNSCLVQEIWLKTTMLCYLQVPFLCIWHEPASWGTPLLYSLQPGHATVFDIWQSRAKCTPNWCGVHCLREAVSGITWWGEEVMAYSWIWGQGRYLVHSRNPQSGWACGAEWGTPQVPNLNSSQTVNILELVVL